MIVSSVLKIDAFYIHIYWMNQIFEYILIQKHISFIIFENYYALEVLRRPNQEIIDKDNCILYRWFFISFEPNFYNIK